MGVGIEDMRTYQANRALGHAKAGDQRDLLLRHAERIEAEIQTLHVHLGYLHAKAALWDARERQDEDARIRGERAGAGDPPAPGGGGAAMSRVLVTGGNGYLGTQVIAALLRQGREVRADGALGQLRARDPRGAASQRRR